MTIGFPSGNSHGVPGRGSLHPPGFRGADGPRASVRVNHNVQRFGWATGVRLRERRSLGSSETWAF